ncbi:MAG: sugar phosphate isomerase/epimerase [Defluviitaleaceae bacterium]|nr:sugar phosphate isomerase/epimerase [Defluviitaleaceae bacterium]
MDIGVVINYSNSFEENLIWCQENSIHTCQLSISPKELTAETTQIVKALIQKYNMEITAMVGNWSGPNEWNFTAGPLTLGIVPPPFRANRMEELKSCARFAKDMRVTDVCTHMGFIPENPCDALYSDFIASLRHLAQYFGALGIRLNMETGQETPTTLLRVISDIGKSNLGINFDPANFLMYGKANPIDAVYLLGPYINGVHAKDGEYPTDGIALGLEKPIGYGRVNMKLFIKALKDVDYKGAITIEREISGEQQRKDILAGKELLLGLEANQ